MSSHRPLPLPRSTEKKEDREEGESHGQGGRLTMSSGSSLLPACLGKERGLASHHTDPAHTYERACEHMFLARDEPDGDQFGRNLNIRDVASLWWTLAVALNIITWLKKKYIRRRNLNDMLCLFSSFEEVKISLLKGGIQSWEHEKAVFKAAGHNAGPIARLSCPCDLPLLAGRGLRTHAASPSGSSIIFYRLEQDASSSLSSREASEEGR
ncbi:unnamed protein product [Pleuronectes platessa]|uniref:Uncharacterized protein n=1 Tax=Pleuronectes platessa TaxID=8262 RepID=A0A9N7ZAE9_PLEPL|nr:unnamed protein product [Pleuronectes platessa]